MNVKESIQTCCLYLSLFLYITYYLTRVRGYLGPAQVVGRSSIMYQPDLLIQA